MRRFEFLLVLALASGAAAQDDPNQRKFDAELEKPFVKRVAWTLDYDAARKSATESGKLVFAYFTRSYAP